MSGVAVRAGLFEQTDAGVTLLGDRCRKAILMGYQGYSSEEIKKQLDLSGEELVRKVRYRCMTKLRDMMDKEPRLLSLLKSLNYG